MIKTLKITSIFIISYLLAVSANARPVSYPGGWTAMQMNDANMNALHVHYSPTAKYSIGYKGEYWKEDKWQFHGLQYNYLVNRWNKKASQANLYLKSAVGVAHSDESPFSNKQEEAGFIGIATDWEDRRFFTSYENRYTYAGDINKSFMQKARVGIAPYVGDYGDLHTWLMLQVQHNPTFEGKEIITTPMVRVFKDVYLFEAGMSFDGDVLFNTVIRF